MISSVEWHPKGWGGEKWIVNNDLYCGKILYFVKGKCCSFHYHKIKDETFYVQSGAIVLRTSVTDTYRYLHGFAPHDNPENAMPQQGCQQWTLRQGDTFHVAPGLRHQIIALEDTELFEFSTHHDEEDSYRIIKGD